MLSLGSALCAGCLALTLLLREPPGTGMLVVATLNCIAFGLLALQQACGTVAIAAALRGRPRYAVVLTTNAFAALGVAMLAQQIATACHAGTSAHYWMAVGAMALLALACGAVFAGAAAHKEGEEGTEAATAAADETGMGPTL